MVKDNPSSPLALILLFIVAAIGCSRDEGTPPELATAYFTRIAPDGATTGGEVISDGGSAITARGVCWGTSVNPTIADNTTNEGSGSGTFTSIITGHSINTTYYVRAYATNDAGTGYGNNVILEMVGPVQFNPDKSYGEVTDIDGNIYRTIEIGTQVWMAENLKTTRLNDGTEIPEIRSGYEWRGMTTPAYCWYNNDSIAYRSVYGALYNWYSVNTEKLCPEGWHVPSKGEWETLIGGLGGSFNSDFLVKEAGNTHWLYTSANVTNGSGFTALPAGYRDYSNWKYLRWNAYFWTTTAIDPVNVWCMMLNLGFSSFGNNYQNGLSVRCVKNYI
jgi:uncharacterized protein (TIGR02145 family)